MSLLWGDVCFLFCFYFLLSSPLFRSRRTLVAHPAMWAGFPPATGLFPALRSPTASMASMVSGAMFTAAIPAGTMTRASSFPMFARPGRTTPVFPAPAVPVPVLRLLIPRLFTFSPIL